MAFADKLFGDHIQYLANALDAMSSRQQVIVNNVANSSTPGFVPQTVAFEDTFRQILAEKFNDEPEQAVTLEGKEPEHITAQQASLSSFSPIVSSQDASIDIHKEMTKLAQNQIMFNAISDQLAGIFGANKSVLDGFGR